MAVKKKPRHSLDSGLFGANDGVGLYSASGAATN